MAFLFQLVFASAGFVLYVLCRIAFGQNKKSKQPIFVFYGMPADVVAPGCNRAWNRIQLYGICAVSDPLSFVADAGADAGVFSAAAVIAKLYPVYPSDK